MAELNGSHDSPAVKSLQVDQSTTRETQGEASDDLAPSTNEGVHSGGDGLLESETRPEGLTIADQLSDILGDAWSSGKGLEQDFVRPGIRLSLDALGLPQTVIQQVETPVTLAFLSAGIYFVTASSIFIVDETIAFISFLLIHAIQRVLSVFLQVLGLIPLTILFFACITVTGAITKATLRPRTAPLSQTTSTNADAWAAQLAQARQQYQGLREALFTVDLKGIVDHLSPWKQRIIRGLTFVQTLFADQQPLVKVIALLAFCNPAFSVFGFVRDVILALPMLVLHIFRFLLQLLIPSLCSIFAIVFFSAACFVAFSIFGLPYAFPSTASTHSHTPLSRDSSETEHERTERPSANTDSLHQALQLIHSIKRDIKSSLESFMQRNHLLLASVNRRRVSTIFLRVGILYLFFVFRWKGKLLMSAILASYGISKAIGSCCCRRLRRRSRESGIGSKEE